MFKGLIIFSCIGVLSLGGFGQNDHARPMREQIALEYFLQGDYAKAANLYEELYRPTDSNPVIYNNYLRCLLELKAYRQAERLVGQQQKARPGHLRFAVDLGVVWLQSGDQRKAQRHFEGLIQQLPADSEKIKDLALSFNYHGLSQQAIQTYLHGRKLLGPMQAFCLQLAALYQRSERWAEMYAEYVDLVASDLTQIEAVQALMQDLLAADTGLQQYDALRQVLLSRTQRYPNTTVYAELLLWLSIQQKDFPMALMQARAIDRRLRQDGELLLRLGPLALNNGNYEVARQAFSNIVDRGDLNPFFLDAQAGLLEVLFREAIDSYEPDPVRLRAVEKAYMQALEGMGISHATIGLVRNLARLQAFYLQDTRSAASRLQTLIERPGLSNRIRAECSVELADILVLQGQVWDAHLLYAQVDKTFKDDPLAHEARFKNARLSYFIGEFDWAQAQLDVLKSATSKLIANDAMELSLRIQDNITTDKDTRPLEMFARAELHKFMNQYPMAWAVLDSLEALFPSHPLADDVLMVKSQIARKTGQYEQADSLLAQIIAHYPRGLLASDALLQRAVLQEEVFRKPDIAMAFYGQLMMDYPGSLHVTEARSRFRALRDKLIN